MELANTKQDYKSLRCFETSYKNILQKFCGNFFELIVPGLDQDQEVALS
jgi:hypothetical protein